MTASVRPLEVPGLLNVRDLGGLPTRDGGTVRPGLVLRSDSLIALEASGLAALRELGLRTVVDLRDTGEIAANGADVLPGPDTRYLHLELLGLHPGPPAAGMDATALAEIALPESPADATRDVYRTLVLGEVPRAAWGKLLTLLADDDTGPALVHCAAGKDRTGVFVWLLLDVLGVDEATITADYLASNEAYEQRWPRELEALVAAVPDPEAVRPYALVDVSYLDAARTAMAESYGTVEAYLRDGLGLAPVTLQRLRDRLLV